MLSFYVLKSTHARSFHHSLFSKEYIFEKLHTVTIIHNTDIALILLIYVGLLHPCFTQLPTHVVRNTFHDELKIHDLLTDTLQL